MAGPRGERIGGVVFYAWSRRGDSVAGQELVERDGADADAALAEEVAAGLRFQIADFRIEIWIDVGHWSSNVSGGVSNHLKLGSTSYIVEDVVNASQYIIFEKVVRAVCALKNGKALKNHNSMIGGLERKIAN